MVTPILGAILLVFVALTALNGELSSSELGFFSWHAFVVVIGGMFGALMLAIDRKSLTRMLFSLRTIISPKGNSNRDNINQLYSGLDDLKGHWKAGEKSHILGLSEKHNHIEIRKAGDLLLSRASKDTVTEEFMQLKTQYQREWGPVMEGWEMVGKLAPSFGMVGTVTGMVQLFQNMSSDITGLGGAMAMALLATLYGITLGAALGGPMSSRILNQINERLDFIELLEVSVVSLLAEEQATSSAPAKG